MEIMYGSTSVAAHVLLAEIVTALAPAAITEEQFVHLEGLQNSCNI